MLKIKKLACIEAGQYLWKLTALYHLIKVNFKHKCGCEGGSVDLSAYTVLGSNPKNKKDENKQKRPVYAHIFKHI